MRSIAVPTWNPFDPIGSTLSDISSKIAEATTSLFATVMSWSVEQGAAVDWGAPYFRQSYILAFTLAFSLALPIILISHFLNVNRGQAASSDLWEVFLLRLPRWLIVSMFGITFGFLLSGLITDLNRAVIAHQVGGSAEEASESITNVITASLTGSSLPVFLAIILGLVILLAALCFFLSSLILTILAQLLAVILPLGLLPDVSARYRGVARKYLTVLLVVMFAMPVQLFIFGFFVRMVADNLDAATLPGAINTSTEGDSPLIGLALLVIGSFVMFVPLFGPFAMLRFLGSMVPTSSGDAEGKGSTPPNVAPSASTPQSASMSTSPGTPSAGGAASGVSGAGGAAAGGAGAGAGAGGAGGAAAGGSMATGATASGGGAATAAAGAGAVTAGTGAVAIAGLSAAGRMAHHMKHQTSSTAAQSAQAASMTAMHLDGREEG